MRALLDINVLLTLLDAEHADHQRAQKGEVVMKPISLHVEDET